MASRTESAAVLILANGLRYLVGFTLPMVLVRLLNRDDYGTYQQLNLIANLGSTLMLFGLPVSVYYFYQRSHRPTLIAQTQILLLIAGTVTAAAIAVFAPRIAAQMHNPSLSGLLPLFALYVSLNIFGELSMNVMISQERYRLELGLELLETAFRVSVLVSVVALGYSLHALVLALIFYAGLRIVGRSYWLWTGPDSMRRASWRGSFVREQMSYSLPVAASSGVGIVGGLLDKMIVAVFFLPSDYAVYSVGALEVPLNTIFQGSVANVLRASLPKLVAEGNLDEVVRIWREAVRKLALVMIPSWVFLMCFAERFITALFTQGYQASTEVFRIYLLVLPLYMFILNAVPQVFGKTRFNFYVSVTMVAANALLSLILLRVMGLLGPATAFVCASYLGSGLYFIVTTKLLKVRFSELVPLKAIARTCLGAGLAVVPAIVAAQIARGIPSLAIGALTFTLCFTLCGYLVGALRSEDVAAARSWLRRVAPGAMA